MSLQPIRLGDALSLYNGKAPTLSDLGEFTVFGSNGVIGKSEKANHPASVILGRVGAYCGAVKFSDEPFWASDNTIIVRPLGGHDLKYWYYKLQNIPLRSYAGGAAQPLITHSIIKPIDTQVHDDIVEQERIASILSAYDDLIENNRRRIALLEEAARQLYREWFVHLRFPGHEHANIIDGVPEGWKRKSLAEHCPFHYGKALKADIRVDGDVDVFGSSGIVGSHNQKLVDGPAIIVGRKGNVGSVFWAHRPFWPIDTVYFIAPENTDLFTYYGLKNTQFISTDVAVPGLNRNYAHSRELLLPDDNLLADFLERVAPMHEQCRLLDRAAVELAKARDLLLPRLMDGRIEV